MKFLVQILFFVNQKNVSFGIISLFFLLISCSNPVSKKEYKSPDEEFGELFKVVQLNPVFADSKTFVDAVPKFSAEDILKKYAAEKVLPGFDLKSFVDSTFTLPQNSEIIAKNIPNATAEQQINSLWNDLSKKPEEGGSMIPMRKNCVSTNGLLGEVFYADSYFTMLGLRAAKKDTLLENTVLSFAQVIEAFGHIPSGNRSYYLSRSEPPFFALMVKLLAESKHDKQIIRKYLPQMQKEYQYWMAAESKEINEKAVEMKQKSEKGYLKTVFLENNNVLNRYYDYKNTPRPEAYKEDIAFAKKSGGNATQIYRELRSEEESNWTNSSRWMKDGMVKTTEILPVDLNALLYNLELTLAEAYDQTDKKAYAESFRKLAEKRKKIFDKYFWNEAEGFYFDYDFVAKKQTNVASLAAVYPLFLRLASPEQAQKVAKMLETKFLKNDGLVSSLTENETSPSLQYVAIQGLRNYNLNDLANKIKKNFVENYLKNYKNTGRISRFSAENGVLLKLLEK